MLPEFERHLVERLLARFHDRRLLAHGEHPVRLAHAIRGNAVTIFEVRPGFDDPSVWTQAPVAQLRLDPRSGLWSLYRRDSSRRWRRYAETAPTRSFQALLTEVDRDPTRIFWG